jgi:hypothetical protein
VQRFNRSAATDEFTEFVNDGQWASLIDSQGVIGWVQIALGISTFLDLMMMANFKLRPGLFYTPRKKLLHDTLKRHY